MKRIIIILMLFMALAGTVLADNPLFEKIVEAQVEPTLEEKKAADPPKKIAQVDLYWIENRDWYRGDTWPEWDKNWTENSPLLSIAIKDKIKILCEETYDYNLARKEWEICVAHQENKAKKVLGEYFSSMASLAVAVAETSMFMFGPETKIVERTKCIRNAIHFNNRARAHIINWELADACNMKLVNDRVEELLRKAKE